MRPYAPRPLLCLGVESLAGFSLRRWWIDLFEEAAPYLPDWNPALELACAALPQHADVGRPGVGLLILHRGRGADYTVLGWWDRENELPLRVFVRYPGSDDAQWRPACGGESVCVWDLEVIARERAAYVASYLDSACRDQRTAWLAAEQPLARRASALRPA